MLLVVGIGDFVQDKILASTANDLMYDGYYLYIVFGLPAFWGLSSVGTLFLAIIAYLCRYTHFNKFISSIVIHSPLIILNINNRLKRPVSQDLYTDNVELTIWIATLIISVTILAIFLNVFELTENKAKRQDVIDTYNH